MDTKLKNNRIIKIALNIFVAITIVTGYYVNIYKESISTNITEFYEEQGTINYVEHIKNLLIDIESRLYLEDEENESKYINMQFESRKKLKTQLAEPINEKEIKDEVTEEYKVSKDYFNSLVNNLNDININIEYYIEEAYPEGKISYDSEKNILYSKTNVGKVSKENFIKEAQNGEYEYILLDRAKNTEKELYGKKYCSEGMETIYNILEKNTSNNSTIYIRIPKVLEPGDELYTLNKEYSMKCDKVNNVDYILKLCISIGIIALIIRLLLIKVKSKKLNIYENIFIETPLILYIFITSYEWKMIANVNGYYDNSIFNIVFVVSYVLAMVFELLLVMSILKIIFEIVIGKTKFEEIKIKSLVIFTYKQIIKLYKISKPILVKNINKIKEHTEVRNAVMRNTWFILFSILALLGSLVVMIPEWLMYSFPLVIYNLVDYTQRYSGIIGLYLVLYFTWLIKSKVSDSYGLNKLKVATENISKGNYKEEVPIVGTYTVQQICKNIKAIEEGLDKAVDQAVKSEKMKGELITNVSHDLKTPLTSIINYIDLLGKNDVTEEDRERYIYVLKGKSERLKILIEDLFEASKAASGNLELFKESIDVVALMRQTLGEFDEKIESSGLNFITKWPEEKLILNLDGRKTFRVFENIISNVLKYSMKNTRVYVEVKILDNGGEIIVKNISAYELNFTEEEIMERFVRGDKSRNTEGSGLGLAIAKSLVELQGGNFKIDIDGDLFKVIIQFIV